MSFLWFVSFCYLADGWRKAYNPSAWFKSGVEAAIAFSFFSTCIFVSILLSHIHTGHYCSTSGFLHFIIWC